LSVSGLNGGTPALIHELRRIPIPRTPVNKGSSPIL
jgi:hypothetical protein